VAFFLNPILEKTPQNQQKNNRKKWLKRLGVAGFVFFLVKGIAWIVVAVLAWKGCDFDSAQSPPKKHPHTTSESK